MKKVEEDAKVLDERPLGVELSPEPLGRSLRGHPKLRLERALKLGTASSDQPSLVAWRRVDAQFYMASIQNSSFQRCFPLRATLEELRSSASWRFERVHTEELLWHV